MKSRFTSLAVHIIHLSTLDVVLTRLANSPGWAGLTWLSLNYLLEPDALPGRLVEPDSPGWAWLTWLSLTLTWSPGRFWLAWLTWPSLTRLAKSDSSDEAFWGRRNKDSRVFYSRGRCLVNGVHEGGGIATGMLRLLLWWPHLTFISGNFITSLKNVHGIVLWIYECIGNWAMCLCGSPGFIGKSVLITVRFRRVGVGGILAPLLFRICRNRMDSLVSSNGIQCCLVLVHTVHIM